MLYPGKQVKIKCNPMGVGFAGMHAVGLEVNGYGYIVETIQTDVDRGFCSAYISAKPMSIAKYRNGIHGWLFASNEYEELPVYDVSEWNID